MLPVVNKTDIAQAVKSVLQRLYGPRLAKLVLYGSYARGTSHEESDIDFLVVLSDDKIKMGQELRYMNSPLFDLQLRLGIFISAHPTTLQRYQTDIGMFYTNIHGEGIEI